jgi:two-component system, chemotaxis family, protein-glutamate methylesterase/glutaminase
VSADIAAVSVMLADDDEGYLESLRTLVAQQPGLSVVAVAHDGLEALERAEELEPDAVVIDLHMPRLDGVSAVARLRRDHPAVCLIALTGDADPKLHQAAEEAGADAVMLKGQILDGLSDRIASVRRRRQPAGIR